MSKIILAFFLLLAPLAHSTNSTDMQVPGNAGRPTTDTVTHAQVVQSFDRGTADCSAGASAQAVSYTSTAINLTFTAGLDFENDGYTGPLLVNIVNTGNSSLVAWAGMTDSAVAGNTPAGQVIAAGTSGQVRASCRDGIFVHLQGLTDTADCNFQVCNY